MASVQEIVDNLLPGELIRLNNYPFFSADAFEKYLLAQGQTEVDETEISYWNQKTTGVRPFFIDNSVRFNPAAIKMASKDEIRNSSVSLPTRFLDEDSGLFYALDAEDDSSEDDGFTVVSADLKRYKPKVDYVTPAMFGAVGNGIADDTVALTTMLATGFPNIMMGRGKNYKVSSELIFSGKYVDMNRSTISANSADNTRGVWVKSNTTLRNGTVTNTVTPIAASNGEFGAGVLVGKYTYTEEVKGVLLESLEISTTRVGGVALPILGNTHGVIVRNCTFPSSAVNAYATIVHWGMLTSTPSEGTFHPHNIKYENIEIGNFSSVAADSGALSVSGSYNISYNNIGVFGSANRAMYVFAGDYGFDYADSETKKAAHTGIKIQNFTAINTLRYGIDINGNGNLGPTGRWSIPVEIDNALVAGTDQANSRGFNIGSVCDSVLTNCTAVNLHAGFVEAGLSVNITLRSCTAKDITNYGFWIQGVAGSEGKGWLLDVCRAYNCNTSSTASRGAFHIDNQRNITLRGCYEDSVLATWGYRLGTNVTGANLYFNHAQASAGVGFSLGSATTYSLVSNFLGNTCDPSIATPVAGMSPLIVETRPNKTRRMRGTAAPTVDTWLVGDVVENTAQAELGAASSKYVITGWICTVAGTPGTWLSQRALTGN